MRQVGTRPQSVDRLGRDGHQLATLERPRQQAVELGLADQLGNLDFVAREVVQAEEIVDYTRHPNVAERLVRRFGAAIGEGSVKAVRSAAPGWR